MATKYNTAHAVLLNNGDSQILPISKAQLIELANSQQGQFGEGTKDVAAALTYLLGKSNTDLEAAKTYTGESIAALDSAISAGTGYVLTGVTEVDGKLTSYTTLWLDASVVSYQGDEAQGAPTTVQGAIEDIQEKLASLAGDGQGSVQSQIETAINNLNAKVMSETGKAIVSVSEANGIVTATSDNIDAQYVDVDNTNLQWDLDETTGEDSDITVQSAIEHLQSEINAAVGDAARYTITEVTGNDVPETVLHRYQLSQSINGAIATKAGEYIDIPKDSSLKEVYLGLSTDTVNATTGVVTKGAAQGDDVQSLNFVYHLEDGTYSLVPIDVSKFLTENEFGDGLGVQSGVVSVKIDNSEDSNKYLSVGANGVALDGNAINTAISTAVSTAVNGLDSVIEAKVENNYSYVMTGVTEADGVLTAATYIGLTDENVKTTPFTGEDLATLLGNDIQNVKNIHDALNKIAGKVNNTQAGAVNNIVITDGSYIKATNASKDSNNTYSFTIDDSALGNVAKLQYDELTWNGAETVTILGANPDE